MIFAYIFIASCLLMHFIQPGLSPVNDAVSFYMTGKLGWILGLGLISLGIASFLVIHRMRPTPSPTGTALLWIWTLGLMVGGTFPPDPPGHWDRPPSATGIIHGTAAMLAFLSFPVAAWLLSTTRILKHIAWCSVVATIVFFACLSPIFRHKAPYALGLIERIVLAFHTMWLIASINEMRKILRPNSL